MTGPNCEPLWYWVREREEIRRRKDAGLDQSSWTVDHVLSTYRFCNVRREDDRVTVWVRENIRKTYADHPLLWLMLCIARQINWPPTLRDLIGSIDIAPAWPEHPGFTLANITDVLNHRKRRGEKVYIGAYMISAPAEKGADKQRYIAETVIGDLWRRRDIFARHFNGLESPSLRRTHELIMRSNGWGQFMAYQAVVDMRFTGLLRQAGDALSWAAAGPGTLRGLNRVHDRPVNAPLNQMQALREMRAIYDVAYENTRIEMDFSDIPNILCETDKYLRVKNGEGRPRALYVAGRGY